MSSIAVDIPLTPSDTNPIDLPVPIASDINPEGNFESQELRAQKLADAAALETIIAGSTDIQDYIGTYLTLINTPLSSDQIRGQTARTAETVKNAGLDRQAFEIVQQGENPAEVREAVETIKGGNQLKAQEKGAVGSFVNEALAGPGIDQETLDLLAADQTMSQMLREVVDGTSIWEVLGDIALEFVPGKPMIDAIQVGNTVNLFEVANTWEQFATAFQALPPQEQVSLFPFVLEWLQEDQPSQNVAILAASLIDPAALEEVRTQFDFFVPLNAAIGAYSFAKGARMFKNRFNLIKRANEVDQPGVAGDLNAAVIVDNTGEAEKAAAISKNTAVNNATPFDVERFDPAATPQLAPEIQDRLAIFNGNLNDTLKAAQRGENNLRPGFVRDQERDFAIQRIESLYDERLKSIRTQPGVNRITQVAKRETPGGIEFDYRVHFTGKDRRSELRTERFTFIQDDVGHYENITVSERSTVRKFWDAFASPEARAKGTSFDAAIKEAEEADIAESVIVDSLLPFVRNVSKSILDSTKNPIERRRSLAKVERVLNTGAQREQFYTTSELKMGIDGIPLNDAEIEAYYKVRALMDSAWQVENQRQWDNLSREGRKLITRFGQPVSFGTPVDDLRKTKEILRNQRRIVRWNDNADLTESTEQALASIDKDFANGWRLIELRDTVKTKDGLWDHVLVRQDKDIRELPQVVTARREGYLPRINRDADWFVQAVVPTSINGRAPIRITRAVRGFDNQADAQEFLRAIQSRERSAIETLDDFDLETTDFVVIKDGTLEDFRVGISGKHSISRPFFSPRRDEPLPFGLPREELDPRNHFLSPFETMNLYLQNLSRHLTRNDWRLAERARWEKTARAVTQDDTVTFDNPSKFALEHEDLGKWHEEILQWSGYRDKKEQWFEIMTQSAYETVLRKTGRGRFSNAINALRHRDPVAAIRSTTFHALLGAFSPSQALVQASGAAAAVSRGILRPDRVVANLFRQNGMLMTQHLKPGTTEFNSIAKAFGWRPETLKKYMDLWHRMGLWNSVRTNADFEAAAKGFPVTSGGVRRAVDSGLLFFRQGELFNRRMAFMDAIEDFGGIDKVLADRETQRKVTQRVGDLLFNLGRANRAWWQKGPVGISTQFLQIMSKTWETILGLNGNFTFWERMRLGMGQVALYGAAGVPFGRFMFNTVAELSGTTREDLENNPLLAQWARGGGSDIFLQTLLGLDVSVAERLSFLNGFDQALAGFWTEETTPWDLISGPTGGVWGRFYDKFFQLSPFWVGVMDERPIPSSLSLLDLTQRMARDVTSLAVAPLSSWSNYEKAVWMMDMNTAVDNNFNVTDRDLTNMEAIATIIGAKNLADIQRQELREFNKDVEEYKAFYANNLLHIWDDYRIRLKKAIEEGDGILEQQVQDEFRVAVNGLRAMVDHPDVWRDINERVAERAAGIFIGETALDKERREFIELLKNDIGNTFSNADAPIITTK